MILNSVLLFLDPIKNKDKIPPQALERRKYKWKIVYDIAPIDDPDVWRLVVLTPVNSTAGNYVSNSFILILIII